MSKASKAAGPRKGRSDRNAKVEALTPFTADASGQILTTNQGVPVNDDQNSLKAGERGGTLLEDFILREKITHFDHERIPERVVHARGSAAHGVFQVYESMAALHARRASSRIRRRRRRCSSASRRSPVRAARPTSRATSAASRSSSTPTRAIFDLVGNNIPVFFIQDAIKFPDLIHAVKPEPHNEMPQAASAHDTFWDFISLMPESMHMIMWVMSDRAIPRSLRMMEGFGVHTFRFVNAKGKSRFVKFHWKPLLGVHSVVWDEAQKISGKDPDFHRRDLWEAIENGDFPEWELGVQIVEEKDEHKFDFDLLDPTKIIPGGAGAGAAHRQADAEPQPGQLLRRDRAGRVPPGPRRARHRLHQRSAAAGPAVLVHRHAAQPARRPELSRDSDQPSDRRRCTTISATATCGSTIDQGRVAYEPNSLGGGCPFQAGADIGGFVSFAERIDAPEGARAQPRASSITSARPRCSSTARRRTSSSTSSTRCGSSWARSKRRRSASGWSTCSRRSIDRWPSRWREELGIAVPAKIDGPLNKSMPADANPKDFQPAPRARTPGDVARRSASRTRPTSRSPASRRARSRRWSPTGSTPRRWTRSGKR